MKFYGETAVQLANSVFPAQWKANDIVVLVHAVENEVASMCILSNFDQHTVELTFAHINRLSNVKEFTKEIFNEIFIHQGKQVAIMITAESNSRMNRLHQRLGHVRTGFIPKRYGTEDGIIYCITKEEAERLWLNRFT